jgi:GT2 family glycosyltransferase
VVIVNWNGRDLLHDCLESLRLQRFRDFQTVVVDNGSTDGSVVFIRERYPEVMLVPLSSNTGFAAGSNAGIRVSAGTYIALLNNDTKADPGWLAELVTVAEKDPSVGMWASKILSFDRPTIIDNTGLLLYRDGIGRGRGRLEEDRGQFDRVEEVLFPSGCAALYHRSVLENVGAFDEAYFAYVDDVDLGLRARWAGWKCLYVPAAVVYHKYSASSSAYSPFKAYLVERNRLWTLLKYFPVELVLASPYFTGKRLLLQLFGAVTGRGASGKFTERHSAFAAAGILLKAWAAALYRLPRICRERRAFAPKRRIGRKEFYSYFRLFGISATELALKE